MERGREGNLRLLDELRDEGLHLHVVERLLEPLLRLQPMRPQDHPDPMATLREIRDAYADHSEAMLDAICTTLKAARKFFPSFNQVEDIALAERKKQPPMRIEASDPGFAAWLNFYRQNGKRWWASRCEEQGFVTEHRRFPPVTAAGSGRRGA